MDLTGAVQHPLRTPRSSQPGDHLPLREQIALVTGSSMGIGAVTARELARRGAQVVLVARGAERLREQARLISAAGGKATAIPADISDPEQVERLVADMRDAFGRIDVLVNNAGIGWKKVLAHSSQTEIRQVVAINLTGPMLLTRAVLPEMLRRNRGTIVNVASVSGRVAVDPVYSATKYGLRGFSLSLRRQLADSGISVCVVSPGKIRTNQNRGSNEPMDEPEVVAEAIVELITNPRREVVVPRKYYAMVWLEQALPGLADRARQWRHRKYSVRPCNCESCITGNTAAIDQG
jgi:short-subunit dehydrogenase